LKTTGMGKPNARRRPKRWTARCPIRMPKIWGLSDCHRVDLAATSALLIVAWGRGDRTELTG
jgi:hypothetical protein